MSTTLAAASSSASRPFHRPVTDNGLPLSGRVPAPAGRCVVTSYAPGGLLNALVTGLALPELIVDGTATAVGLSPFDPVRQPGARTE